MNKQDILAQKFRVLLNEMDSAMKLVDSETQNYLLHLIDSVERYLKRINEKSLSVSKGGGFGLLRAVTEYDNLGEITSLCNAAYDVDIYYSTECQKW